MERNSEGSSSGPCAAGEGGIKSGGVPGHEIPAEGARAGCQAAEAEEDHLGVYPGLCGAHPGRSLWKGDQSDNHLLL